MMQITFFFYKEAKQMDFCFLVTYEVKIGVKLSPYVKESQNSLFVNQTKLNQTKSIMSFDMV